MRWLRLPRSLILLTVAICIVAAVGLTTRLDTAKKCLSFGVSSNYQYSGTLADATHDIPELRRDGVSTVREDFLWSTVQPDSPEEWKWETYDRLIAETSALGVRVLPIIGYGTSWASAPGTASAMPSTDAGQLAYARYAAAVVARYGPNGTFWITHPAVPRLPIEAVELWNEPWFTKSPSVSDYLALVRLAGQAVHRQSKTVLVVANVDDRGVGNATSAAAPLWGAVVLAHANELQGVVDRWAIHPYPRDSPGDPAADAIAQVTWLQQLLTADRVVGDIWVTEIGFSTAARGTAQTVADSFRVFITSMARTSGPHRVAAVWAFTAARPSRTTRPGSFDYGYNLVDASGGITPSLHAAMAARCVTT